jgi:hypothetical protein
VETLANTTYFTHSTGVNPEQITVISTGYYRISYGVNIDQDNANRAVARAWVEDDSVEINNSYSHDYMRGVSLGRFGSCTATFIANITASSVIELHCDAVDGDGVEDFDTMANQCWLLIELIRT